MTRSSSCFVLAAVIQVIFGAHFTMHRKPKHSLSIRHQNVPQNMPRYCWRPPDVDLDKCCPTPNLYSDEVMASCGFDKPPVNRAGDPVRPKGAKLVLPLCRDGLCLMTSANLTLKNTDVDYKKLDVYIDQWAAANPEFTKAILEVKPICAAKADEFWRKDQLRICDQDRIYICLASYLLWNCKIKPFKDCRKLKHYIKTCRKYYDYSK
uniref:Odorant binding protein n=1 Tax=Athetis dissimilis TaxID=1737331 RepID=A0A4D6Q6T8_ATHDI|nr:odorant binding protein [Athetis dissimilis]